VNNPDWGLTRGNEVNPTGNYDAWDYNAFTLYDQWTYQLRLGVYDNSDL